MTNEEIITMQDNLAAWGCGLWRDVMTEKHHRGQYDVGWAEVTILVPTMPKNNRLRLIFYAADYPSALTEAYAKARSVMELFA